MDTNRPKRPVSGTGREPGTRPRKKKSRGVRAVQKMVNTFSYILMIVGVSLLLSAFGILLANDMFALVKEDQSALLVLDEDMSVKETAKILVDQDIISYGWAFRLFTGMSRSEVEVFKAGSYEVDSGMDYGQIIDMLTRSTRVRETVMVSIPEGYTLYQIATLMEEKGVCGYDEFLETANTYEYSHKILRDVPMIENRLEGYLFPDTYEFYKGDSPKWVINKMLNNFVNKFTPEMRTLVENREMSMQDIIIIASMIEREAKVGSERTTISGVIYNRLANPSKYPNLQIDATLLYAIGHKEVLTEADLKIDSPYNTYKASGLPPTAICNPGLSSILAAISPDQHSYHFYVVDDPEEGTHVFSKTLEEHQKNINKIKQRQGS